MKSLITILAFTSLLGTPSFGENRTQSVQLPPESNSGVVWFDIMASDFSRASQFYSKLFGWAFSPQSKDYYFIEAGPRSIGGLMPTQGASNGGGVAIYFAVNDIRVKLEQAENLGATVVVNPTNLPSGKGAFALFRDLDGNLIGLITANQI